MKWPGFFLLLQCHNWKSNSRQLSGTSLRDLNSGRFTNWATAAMAATNSLPRHKNVLAFSEGLIRFFISRSLAPVCDQSWDEIIRSEFKNEKKFERPPTIQSRATIVEEKQEMFEHNRRHISWVYDHIFNCRLHYVHIRHFSRFLFLSPTLTYSLYRSHALSLTSFSPSP